ncbi:MAG: haloacid dehalogenase-like hydrolase [Oscillospiraceae bacterium]
MTVYDFDNTIYQGESGFDIFIFFIKKDAKRVTRYIPKFTEGFIKYKLGRITTHEVLEKYGSVLKEYCSTIPDINADIRDFWDEYESKIKSFYPKIHTDDDIIVSACPEFILSEICKRIGVKNYIGSIINTETWDIERVCYKEDKIKAFYQTYGEVEIDDFYTDSISDKPMMDISKNVYFVTGDRIQKVKANGIYLDDRFCDDIY